MRIDPIKVGYYVHAFNRGNRKMPIVYDEADRWRFLKSLRYFNDRHSIQNLFRELNLRSKEKEGERIFDWPKDWPPQKRLVKILSYCLMPNHFHLLLQEIEKGGISKFMQKLGHAFTSYINVKYGETGRLFQGSYQGRNVEKGKPLEYVDAYIQVINPLELYSGGHEKALQEFDRAIDFVLDYKFCSLGESFNRRNLRIIERGVLSKKWNNLQDYKDFCYKALVLHNDKDDVC